jgi:hypothetical protein
VPLPALGGTPGAACTALLLALAARGAWAHPLHSSVAEITYDARARTLGVSIRLFADDLQAAVRGTMGDAAVYRYVAARFTLRDAGGRAVALRMCGSRRARDVVVVCLRAAGTDSPAGARVRSVLLTELYADQVNLVKATYGGRRVMLLFSRGDGAKPLP